jgi:hypothetical protein
MFVALTWGQDRPGDDPRSSFFWHAALICIILVPLIGKVIFLRSYDSLATRISVPDQSLGEEVFGVVLIALSWSLYIGLRGHSLPAVVYAKHLESTLTVVFVAILLIVLWSDEIFDRR